MIETLITIGCILQRRVRFNVMSFLDRSVLFAKKTSLSFMPYLLAAVGFVKLS